MQIELKYASLDAAKAYGNATDDLGAELLAPAYATPGSAAFDLRAMINETLVLHPGEQYQIPTGISLNMVGAFQPGANLRLAAIIIPRSGRGSKEGLCIANTVGLIDEDFTGEIGFTAWARPMRNEVDVTDGSLEGPPLTIKPGERIGQLMFVLVPEVGIKVVSEFSTITERGAGGFGSTGNG